MFVSHEHPLYRQKLPKTHNTVSTGEQPVTLRHH